MRENCTYGSMRGRAYPITRGVPLYSTPHWTRPHWTPGRLWSRGHHLEDTAKYWYTSISNITETNHRELSTFSCSGVRPHRPRSLPAPAVPLSEPMKTTHSLPLSSTRSVPSVARPSARQSPQATKPRKSAPLPPTGATRNTHFVMELMNQGIFKQDFCERMICKD